MNYGDGIKALAGAFLFEGFMFGDFGCPKCNSKGTIKVRTSRKVTNKYTEYYVRCKNCGDKGKAVFSIESSVWPSNFWTEEDIRREFKPWQVVEHIFEIKSIYEERSEGTKAKIARLNAELKAAKAEAIKIERTYDLLLDIAHEASAKQRI
ncbi:ogr/Delta-like zinc finger family protein [Chromobacterium sp. ATCC 53434]|uniref:ogr/Delta-like zinc finger family protein n=1 Tax=Chromobacterium sp. (strain ATCC 53434 / SC 14030) TaxID=2059672 RepID=UPI0013051B7C|nr:ogr/Delta-like zinc finger family protein [Chromobacterium sp. ATCC 53434]